MEKTIQFFKESAEGIWLFFRYGPARVSKWQSQSIYDDLTGLYNRRFFQEIIKRELAKAKRSKWQDISYPISLILIDIDNFKRINDEEGHLAGDKVLQSVAVLLKKVCREVDIIFRVGGDEFKILLPETTKEKAHVVKDRLEALAEKELFSPKGRSISLSCGLAEGSSLEALEEADVKMYQEKKSKTKT